MILEGVQRLNTAWDKFQWNNPKMRVRLTLKNGDVIIGVPFAVTDPEPDEMDLGDCLVFPGPTKNSSLRGYYDCDVETVELIEV